MRETLVEIIKETARKHGVDEADAEWAYDQAYEHHKEHHGSLKPYKLEDGVHAKRIYVQMLQERQRFCFRYATRYIRKHGENV